MTTLTIPSIEQKRLATFMTAFKPSIIRVKGIDGLLFLDAINAQMVIGEHEGDDVEIAIDDPKAVAKYIRTAKSKADIEARIEDGSLVLDCEALGPMTFPATKRPKPTLSFDKMVGKLVHEISDVDVKTASEYLNRCDTPSGRYALGCFYFDNRHAIATDGCRLVRLELTTPTDGSFMVPASAIRYAAKCDEGVLFMEQRIITGEVLTDKMEGRYHNWTQVIGETNCATELDVEAIREKAEKYLKELTIKGETEAYGFEFDVIPEVSVTIDCRYLLEAIKGLSQCTIKWDCASVHKKTLTGAVQLGSDDRPEWLEVIMPMRSDR